MFKDGLLEGKRALISGGGTGLGKAMGERYMELGADLVICGRREQVLNVTADELSGKFGRPVEVHQCDIRDADAVDAMVDAAFAAAPIDILVNNAAGNILGRYETLSPRAIDAVLGIVLHGAAYLTLSCGRRWIESGHAANVLSIVTTYAWTGSAYVVPSAMGKAGALAMTRSLAAEWGHYGIRLNAIAPGPFPTKGAWDRLLPDENYTRQFETRMPMGRPGNIPELADLAAFLVSDGAGYITGEVVTFDGGEWIGNAGQFNIMQSMSEADWQAFRERQNGR